MNPQANVSLSQYSTMGLGGIAAFLTEAASRMEVLEALSWAQQQNLPVMMIGGGSNIIWTDKGFNGLVIVNKIKRFEVFDEDGFNVYITVGAGENWDSVVERSVQTGLTGIEALSLIPGTAGATPIQNVGAYGQEISQVLTSLEAFDISIGDFVTIAGSDCGLGYRTSRFKTADRGRFFITALTLHLTKGAPKPPFYDSVQRYFEDNGITDYSPQALRDTVMHIRSHKLPDPAKVRNCGSFFANPIVSQAQYNFIASNYDNVPHWDAGEYGIKLSAAWLIDKAGYKDYHDSETGMATWPSQALVLVNEKAQSTSDLLKFKDKIVNTVREKFDIQLSQEPELLGL